MKVHRNIESLPSFQRAVITIGSFDGVHTGHLQIIRQVTEEARHVDGDSVVITFFPHPKRIIGQGQQSIRILNTLEEKVQLLEKAGIRHLVVVPFTEQFSSMPPGEYVSDFLVRHFHPRCIVVGYDHKFGKNRQGGFGLLSELAPRFGFTVREIPAHVTDSISISSTAIRERLMTGDVTGAGNLLGYPYFFSGRVVKGSQIGRTIGFPTANLEPADEDKLIPGNGVYAVDVTIGPNQIKRKGMMNIGVRPTVQPGKTVIEVHILDFSDSVYEETITVYMKARIRDEKKFRDVEELRSQLMKDRDIAAAM